MEVKHILLCCESDINDGNASYVIHLLTAYLIRNPPASLTFLEGQTMVLTYKLLINRFVLVFKRNDVIIGKDSHNNDIEPGRLKTLTIQHITLSDEGEYVVEAPGLKSRPTMVTVKRMLIY